MNSIQPRPVVVAPLLAALFVLLAAGGASADPRACFADGDVVGLPAEVEPADPCDPNVDLFSTVEGFTEIIFGSGGVPELPAGFFSDDSAAWSGSVALSGFPWIAGGTSADTAVLRSGTPGPGAPVRVSLLQMDLNSIDSIKVASESGEASSWLVAVGLDGPQPQGSLTATFDSAAGGTFDANLSVVPALTFINLEDVQAYQDGDLAESEIRVRMLDFAEQGLGAIDLNFQGVPFSTSAGPTSEPCGSFFPGVTSDGENVIISTAEPFEPVRHVFEPPPKPPKKCQYTHASSTSSDNPHCLPSCPAPAPPFAKGKCVTWQNCKPFQVRRVKCAIQGGCVEVYVLTGCS